MITLEQLVKEWTGAPEEQRAAALAALTGRDATPAPPRLLRRAEVAARLHVCTRVVDDLARRGALIRRAFPGRSRAAGFLESDIDALVMGRAAGKE